MYSHARPPTFLGTNHILLLLWSGSPSGRKTNIICAIDVLLLSIKRRRSSCPELAGQRETYGCRRLYYRRRSWKRNEGGDRRRPEPPPPHSSSAQPPHSSSAPQLFGLTAHPPAAIGCREQNIELLINCNFLSSASNCFFTYERH